MFAAPSRAPSTIKRNFAAGSVREVTRIGAPRGPELRGAQVVLAEQALERGAQHPRVRGGGGDVPVVPAQEVLEVRALERVDDGALRVAEAALRRDVPRALAADRLGKIGGADRAGV